MDDEAIPFDSLLPAINEGLPTDKLFGGAEAREAAMVMTNANEIMLSDDIVYKI
jgi:DNA replication licensing factor MCM3